MSACLESRHVQEAGRTDDEFHDMVTQMLDRLARKKRETLLRQVFFKMDVDCSGSIDFEEFENLKDGSPEDEERLEIVYSYLDGEGGDGDGEIDIDEWVNGMKYMGEDMEDAEFEAEVRVRPR